MNIGILITLIIASSIVYILFGYLVALWFEEGHDLTVNQEATIIIFWIPFLIGIILYFIFQLFMIIPVILYDSIKGIGEFYIEYKEYKTKKKLKS